VVDKDRIVEELKKRVQDGKIGCRQCFQVAAACDVSLKLVGQMCDEHDIRIRACQLGCFK